MMDVNVYHYAMMLTVFLPWLIEKRAKHNFKTAFVAVSSSSYLRYFPYFLTYTSTKGFATQLTSSITKELQATEIKNKIDLQTVVPFATKTNVVEDPRLEIFGTPVYLAVNAFLLHLANDYKSSFGTFWNEAIARFSFEVIGFFLSPLFDIITSWLGRQVK